MIIEPLPRSDWNDTWADAMTEENAADGRYAFPLLILAPDWTQTSYGAFVENTEWDRTH